MLNHHQSTPKASLRRPAGPLLASAAVAALAFATPALAQSDLFNEWDVPSLDPQTSSFGPTGMEFDFQGDATACIPTQAHNVSLTNPWYAFTQWNNLGGPSGNIPVVYDANANLTRVTEPSHGQALPVPAVAPGLGFPGPTDGNGSTSSYHVGLNNGFGSACVNNPLVVKRWIWKDPYNHNDIQYQDIPVTAARWSGGDGQKQNFKRGGKAAVLYLETVNGQGVSTSGTWTYVSYIQSQNGSPATFVITNNGAYTITLANDNGIVGGLSLPADPKCLRTPQCVENQEILDTLNNQYFPVYGQPNSPFTPLTQLNGYVLEPGQSVTVEWP